MKNRSFPKKKIDFLHLVPVRNIKWEKNEEGLIVLLRPKFKNPFLSKYLLPHMKNPYYKIRLDSVGSFIWEHCDGNFRVKEVAERLENKFGEKVEPLNERLVLFLQSLGRSHFIIYREK